MKKKIITTLFAISVIVSITACSGNAHENSNNQQSEQHKEDTQRDLDTSTEDLKDFEDDSELSQSEWMEKHAGEYEDGYEVVDTINIDSGDTKLEYISNEKYTLESGEEILLVNFNFTNVSAGATNLDSHYNFQAFQDGVEVDVYATLFDQVEGDVNRSKEILNGSSINVSVGIAPNNWESPIKLRVDDAMPYDTEEVVHTYQQQEIPVQ